MEPHGAPYRSPPRSPQWLEAEYQPLQLEVPRASPTLKKRQSLRLRPEALLFENGEPPSPLNLSFQSAPSPTLTSRMSLLNLFSAPKVETQRGYAEPSIDLALGTPPIRTPTASKSNLVLQVDSDAAPAGRPASVFSGKTTATKWTKWKPKSRQAPVQAKERKPASFEAPPLFQAYPQSTKDGTLEIASISVEALNKEKSKSNGLNKLSLDRAVGDRTSAETKRTSALKYLANGSTSVELPRKIFVLVTSGYLLQYAERGASDRLPEKVLHLGKDSAAFACDLVPGKHYVLQVSQAVDSDGIIIANSGSFLSRLGIRTAAAKRMTSNLILVLPNAGEMESWMTALREEIEALGGKKILHHTARPKTTGANGTKSTTLDLKKTPSQSHRYQVKRNPSKVSSVTSPRPYQTSFPPVLPDIDVDRSERATIDDIEFDAAILHRYLNQPDEDIPDISDIAELSAVVTPPAVVVKQPEFDIAADPPEAPNESVHISPANTAVTAPTWRQRKSSSGDISLTALISNPTTPKPTNNDLSESLVEPSKPTKPSSSARESIRKAPPPPLALHSQTIALKRPLVDESPIIPNYPSLSQRMSTRLTNAYTERNFPDGVPSTQKHDSKVSSPSPAPALPVKENDVDEIPEIVTVQRPKRNSSLQNLQNFRNSNGSLSYRNSIADADPAPIRKVASFSMPLKVNPTATNGATATGNVRRHSRMDEIGYALTPAGDSSVVEFNSESQPYSLPMALSNGFYKHTPSNSPPGRLSLFPSPRSSQIVNPNDNLKRLPSNAMRQSLQSAATNGAALRRPNSLQVRSDHAPFLASSARNSTGTTSTTTTTVPIRAMKPSRSASNVASLAKQQSSIEEFKALNFNTSTLDEEVDLAMPLPADHANSAAFNKPASRGSLRKSLKAQSSLPNLDFGLPVVGLGPPAPPPRAPLPAPPPLVASRTTSPTPLHVQNGGIDSVAGLGISV